ncbi:DsbA family protein [Phenylobacterium sp.]|uniref:DsbA family protein n=1 Tax=Phenylobacterium sp. TaxID=1871053 RepID=UPI002735AFB9|nr:DsbA family protein [Phenylobacterium sp.]MDP3659930.1 DsbA family protein [Phenylobacterium sp.]
MRTIATALSACAAALILTGCSKPADDAFGRRVHAYLMEHPEVIEEAVKKLQAERQTASLTASRTALASLRPQLERDPRDFVANPDGKVTVVEFFDYRCGYCKVAAPDVLKIIADNPDVRFVFKEMPIFGEVSDTAARIALTDAGKGAGLKLYGALMADKALDEAAVDRHLVEAGIDPAAARRAADAPEIIRQIADVRTLANALQISGTPAFIVGDRLIAGADMDALNAAIAEAKEGPLQQPG